MHRAGKLIRGLKLCGDSLSTEDLLRAAWPQAVGQRIAAHARIVAVRESQETGRRLIVEVEDVIWQKQLQTMCGQILPRLRDIAGKDSVQSIEFRLGVPRRMPKRAEQVRGAADEADGIQDPILRRLYKESRKRSAV
jgi:predicted nucleic acid-binding Zn ribbon protein